MKLWNIKTGALWEGSPVDARELLTRPGWSKDEPVPVPPPEIATENPVEEIVDNSTDESLQQEPESVEEKPREKRKYTRHWDR